MQFYGPLRKLFLFAGVVVFMCVSDVKSGDASNLIGFANAIYRLVSDFQSSYVVVLRCS